MARFTSSSLDSTQATKPTGIPTIKAGTAAPASTRSSRASSAVGALPTANDRSVQVRRQFPNGATERVVFSRWARGRHFGNINQARVVTPGGRAGALEMPISTIRTSETIAAPPVRAAKPCVTASGLNRTAGAIAGSPSARTQAAEDIMLLGIQPQAGRQGRPAPWSGIPGQSVPAAGRSVRLKT